MFDIDLNLIVIEQINIIIEKLNEHKTYFQSQLDSKKAPAPPPLPPPLPQLLQPKGKPMNIKTIEGSSISKALSMLQPVSTTEKQPTLFDIEIAATVKWGFQGCCNLVS